MIAIDFDGTLCDRRGIPRRKTFSMDEKPKKNALKVVKELSKKHILYVLTANTDLERIKAWLGYHGFPEMEVTNIKKEGTKVIIDDRALRFTNWLDISKYFI